MRSCKRSARVIAELLAGFVLVIAGAAAALAGPPAGGATVPGSRAVFDALARAWDAEDHAALAARVAPDGVDIAIGQGGARNHYSASQAFYFFKTLFQTTETVGFRYRLLSEEPEAGLVHAVAEWTRRRAGEEAATAERLIVTLARGDTGWGLTAVRAIR